MVPEFINIFILAIWLPQILDQILAWLYWWQDKEYRVDRFKLNFRYIDGRKELKINGIIVKLVLLILVIYYPLFSSGLIFYLLYLDLISVGRILGRKTRKPVFTQRARRIFATSILFVATAAALVWQGQSISKALLFGEISSLLSGYLGILWTLPIVNKIKRKEIEKAKSLLEKFNPIVIGVTGSYGKTTTKDFIGHLLSKKYKTEKNIGSQNTEFGIIRNIINNVKRNTEYLVLEIGAYKKGEIKSISDIVKPQIGVITGIEGQHLELFGSMNAIKTAKYELIKALPKNGTAIFNVSNKYCSELMKKTQRERRDLKVLSYLITNSKKFKNSADITAKMINDDTGGVNFEIRYMGKRRHFFAPINGEHFVENILAAILIAKQLGLNWKEIEEAVDDLSLPEDTMNVFLMKNGNIVVNDTFNSTPTGFNAALGYLEKVKSKNKVVIMTGIIELGNESDSVHESLGQRMAKSVNLILLRNKQFESAIKKGLGEKSNRLILIDDIAQLIKRTDEILNLPNTVILLEGKLPQKLLELVKGYK